MRAPVERCEVKTWEEHVRAPSAMRQQHAVKWTCAILLFIISVPALLVAIFAYEGRDPAHILDEISPSFGLPTLGLGFGQSAVPDFSSNREAGWPVIVHRAGDGAFYGDLRVGLETIAARIDLDAERTTINPVDFLNAGLDIVADGGEVWLREVGLEHKTAENVTLLIGDRLDSETVIGRDLLDALGGARIGSDHLRIASD